MRTTSPPWLLLSTADRARRSGGRRPPRPSTPSSDPFRLALRQPVETGQYCSIEYQAELRRHGILISMSGKGNCYDNSMVETFFKTLKSELVWRTVFQTRGEASDALARYIDGFYNPVRRHSALGFVSPAQFERRTASQTAA